MLRCSVITMKVVLLNFSVSNLANKNLKPPQGKVPNSVAGMGEPSAVVVQEGVNTFQEFTLKSGDMS